MAHTDARITALQAELGQLQADQASENAALNAARPAGIPATWTPITHKRGEADWIVIGWLDPDFEVSAFSRVARGGRPVTPPGGPPVTP